MTIHQCKYDYAGCPRLVRTDRGTENVNMAFIQKAFRHRGQDELSGSNSHRYGRSIANQVCVLYIGAHVDTITVGLQSNALRLTELQSLHCSG